MKNFNLFSRKILPSAQVRPFAGLAMVSVMAFLMPDILLAQMPSISYNSPQTYNAGVTITSLSPSSSNVSGFGYSIPAQVGSGFNYVNALAADASGNIFVCDNMLVTTGHGGMANVSFIKEIFAFNGSISTLYSDSFSVNGLAVDPSGNMFLIDNQNDGVTEVPHGGDASTSFKIGSGFNHPQGIAADGAGNVFVADYNNFAVKKILAGDGAVQTLWTGGAPNSVAVDRAGDVFFTVLATGDLYKIPAGNSAATRITGGVTKVATDAGGNLIVLTNSSVQLVASGSNTATTIAGDLGNVTAATVDPSGNVWMGALTTNDSLGVKKMKPVGGYFISPQLPLGLSFDNNTGTISGTPLAGSAAKDYTVTAFSSTGKASATVNIKVNNSTDATLSDLELSTGTISPAFASATTDYTATVGSSVSSITVMPSSNHNASSITVNGDTVASGTASGNISLQAGDNTISIVVTAQDGSTQKTYTVVVTRQSSNANLSGLTLSSGTLSPSILPGTFSYTATVANTVSSLTVTPVTQATGATVTVNGTPVADLTASQPVSLNVGSNTITVAVTAQDGVSKNTYTVTVIRLIPPPAISYGGAQSYTAGTAITTLTPTSSGVATWGYSSSATSIGSGLIEPLDVASDPGGNLYVADGATNNIVKIPAGNGTPAVLAAFSTPLGIAVDAAGNVYVAAASAGAILEIPAGGGPVNPIGSGFVAPSAVAVDASGNVYVADTGNGALEEIPAGNGTPVTIQSGFNSIQGVAVDAAGNIYVADAGVGTTGNGAVYKIPFGLASMASVGTGFSRPSGVVVDAAGNLYVSDLNKSVITVIEPNGTQFNIGSGFNSPNGVAIDGSGNVYIADSNNGAVKKANITGGYFLSPALPAGLTFNNNSGAISGTPSGSSPATNYSVTAANISGSSTATINITVNLPPLPAISYSMPPTYNVGTAIAPLSPLNTGGLAAAFGFTTPNAITTNVSDPVSMTMDKSGNMYIGAGSGNVWLLPAGSHAATVFASGFGAVWSVKLDASNNVYVADGSKVWKIPAGGGTPVSIGSFVSPIGLAFDGAGNLYVGDNSNSNPGVYKIVPGVSGQTRVDNNLRAPAYIAFDSNGNLFIGDQKKMALYEIPAGGTQQEVAAAVSEIKSLATDVSGNVYFSTNTSISCFSPGTGVVTVAPIFGDGLMTDASINLYCADGSNIFKMSPAGGYFASPQLPGGIIINSDTGVISGTPVSVAPAANYIIKAFNASGSSSATINLTVNPAVPTISYPSPQSYQVGTPIAVLSPSSSNVATWAYSGSATSVGSGLIDPVDVAADAAGNVYVADAATNNIVKIPAGNGTPVTLAALSTPLGIAADATGNVYVAAASSGVILQIPAGGGAVIPIGSGFVVPSAVAVDGAGNVYVADSGNGALKEVPAGNGAPVTIKSGFNNIQGVAVDAAGNLYVADAGAGTSGNGAVYKIPAAGGTMIPVGTGFSRPGGVAVDAAGNLYVADINKSAITVIEPDGTQFTIGAGFNAPNGVIIDGLGNVYIADSANGKVKEVKITGGYFLSPLLPPGLTFNNSTGVISGTPSVAAAANYTVTAYNGVVSGQATINISVVPVISYNSPVAYATGAAVTPLAPSVSGGTIAAPAFNATATTLATGLSDATCLTMGPDGCIYIGESSGKVSILAVGGSSTTVLATGFSTSAFTEGIAADASGNVYFADGAALWKIPAGGGTATRFGSFAGPTGVALDATGNIYVADDGASPNGGVYKMAPDGTGKTTIINVAQASVTVDHNGNLFSANNAPGVSEVPSGGILKSFHLFSQNVKGVSTDLSGNFYALTLDNHITMLPANGSPAIQVLTGSGTTTGLAIDTNFNVYTVVGGNIVKVNATGGYFTNPQLPAGLNISPATGAIAGTPVAATAPADYIIKAFNPYGSASANVNITVSNRPVISYNGPQIYIKGTTITPLLPASTGGTVSAPGFNSITTTLSTGVTDATCMAMDNTGNIYIGESSGKVSKLTAGGTSAVVFATGFGSVSGIAVDASNNVFVADGGSIWKIPAGGGTAVTLGSFSRPTGVALDASGYIYVSAAGASAVYKMAGDGTGQTKISGNGVGEPGSIAVDANGNVFFVDDLFVQLYEIPFGGTQKIINGVAFQSVATDASGNLYIGESEGLGIMFSPAGGGSPIQAGAAIPGVVTGVMVDPSLNIYFADGGIIRKMNAKGGYFINPELPNGLTINPNTGAISGTPAATSGATNYTVTAFSGPIGATAALSITVNNPPPVISYATPQTYTPGVAITPLVPSSTGAPVGSFGFSTTTPTMIPGVNDAVSLAMDRSGNLYIGEGTGNISMVPAGASTSTVFATGFPAAWSIAIDAADHVFLADGAHVWKIPAGGGTAVSLGNFHSPVGLTVDAAGSIYVADNAHATGGVFKINSDGTGQTRIDNNLSQPAYIAFDNNSNLYIGDQSAGALYEIPAGGVQKQVASGLGVIRSVTTDPSGNVYISTHSGGIFCYSPVFGLTDIDPVNTNGLMTDPDFNLYYASGNVYKINPSGGYFTNPQLPAGLNIDPNTGIISGTPAAVLPALSYTVSAFSGLVSGTATVNIAVRSTDAGLAGLAISKGVLSPAFATATTRYTATVGNGVTAFTVTPTTSDANATVTVNGTAVSSGTASGPIALSVGSNNIVVIVSAADGVTQQTYTITVTEAKSLNDNLASVRTSAGLAQGTTVPTTLTENVVNSVTSLTITPTVDDPTATVTVNGVSVTSGGPSGTVALSVGVNTITIVVTAQDTKTKTYTLSVTRAPSANTSLSNLVLNKGTLAPVFGTATNYLAYVANGIQLTVTPTTADPNATLTINGTVAPSGAATAVPIVVGNNTITIVVTAQDKISTKTYTVVVNEARSPNNTLFSFKTSGGLAKGQTVPTTLTENVRNSQTSITVTPRTVDATATVTVNGATIISGQASASIPLAVGDNTITTIVTAQNNTTLTYTLTVTRAAFPSTDNVTYQPVGVDKPVEQIQSADEGIIVHQAISPNGDGIDDFLQIDNITQYPDNNLKIMNRNGLLVYEVKGYDNSTKTFDGHSNKTGQMQIPGTYFYSLDYTVKGIVKHKTGFLMVKY